MITISRRLLAAVIAAAVLPTVALPSAAMGDERVALEGLWTGDLGTGDLGTGADQVGLAFRIGEDGAGTVRILDPGGASTLAVRVTSSSASHVIIEAAAVNGRFEGSAQANGRLEGRWRQGSTDLPLVLIRKSTD